jgi:hypothetical protein
MKYISVDVKILISARIEKEEFEDIQTKLGAALRKEFFTKKYYEISKSKLPFHMSHELGL